MQSIKEMVDVTTVVGDAVETNDGSVIIPISQVAFGFGAGGGEYEISKPNASKSENGKAEAVPFAGGSGAGVSVKPVGFLVVRMNDVRLIAVNGNPLAERVVDIAPQIIDKIEHIMQKNKHHSRVKEEIN